jgi:4-amino-4-deoxy-L-arabinose transferase-like glycosyltransferase
MTQIAQAASPSAVAATAAAQNQTRRRRLAILLLAGLALRLVLFLLGPAWHPQRALAGDSSRYMLLADTWRQRHRFGLVEEEQFESSPVKPFHALRLARGEVPPRIDGVLPELLRTPGYPALLALVRAAGAPWQAVSLLQVLLSSAAAAILFTLVRRWLGSERAGLVAAAILALNPADAVAANLLLTESLYAFMFLGAMALLLRGPDLPVRWPRAAAAGAILGLAALVRPVGLLIGVGVALWLALTRRRRQDLTAAAALMALSLLPAGLWAAHNARLGAGFQLTNVGTIHMAKTAALMEMRQAGQTRYPEEFWPHFLGVVDQVRREIRPDETVDAATQRIVRQRIGRSGGAYASLMASSAGKFMLDHSAGDLCDLLGRPYRPTGLRDRLLAGHGSWQGLDLPSLALPAAWTALNVLLAVLAAVGLVRLMAAGRWAPLLLLAGCMLYFILATQSHGMERMRLPVLWAQAAMAGCAFLPRRRATLVGL